MSLTPPPCVHSSSLCGSLAPCHSGSLTWFTWQAALLEQEELAEELAKMAQVHTRCLLHCLVDQLPLPANPTQAPIGWLRRVGGLGVLVWIGSVAWMGGGLGGWVLIVLIEGSGGWVLIEGSGGWVLIGRVRIKRPLHRPGAAAVPRGASKDAAKC